MNNRDVAELIEHLAQASELLGENPFKSRAYHRAARTLRGLEEPVVELVRHGKLGGLDGFGKALVEKVTTIVETGELPQLRRRMEELPAGLFDMLEIPGLGVKRVRALWEKLEITNLGELEYACLENRLLELEGFGEKMQYKVLAGIEQLKRYRERRLYPEAEEAARELGAVLDDDPRVARWAVVGSLRRHAETIGDIDLQLQVTPEERSGVNRSLLTLDESSTAVEESGDRLRFKYRGIPVEVRHTSPERWAAALVLNTGNADHREALLARAAERDIELESLDADDEAGVYAALDLDWVAPELREGLGEVEAAAAGELPELIETVDIAGVLHVHTTASDGAQTLEELVETGVELGYAYIGVSDHSQAAFYADGLSAQEISAQLEEIKELNMRGGPCRLLSGTESDINADGSLDYPDEVLARLDFVIASVHSNLAMDKDKATERILAALDNPYCDILGHPTGRLLLAREGYELDWDRVLERLVERRVALELNASPMRFDADWRVLRRARELGIPVTINPDAHNRGMFDFLPQGVGIARKGWLRPGDVLNTRSAEELLAWIRSRRP
ncbi:MAG: histidinol-phosphatase [Candidatus Coatesbacteria bacterium]|nr:histidinol-phosphatase [Candidatus Coatesbacteria bacterium]